MVLLTTFIVKRDPRLEQAAGHPGHDNLDARRDVVELRGRIKGQHGATAVAAKGVVLVTARL